MVRSTLTNSTLGTSLNTGGAGFIGGLQAGYNFQVGHLLFGIEGDVDWTTFAGTSDPVATTLGNLQASANINWISTAAARVGITSDRLLLYGKLVAVGPIQRRARLRQRPRDLTGSRTDGGWLVGAGMEYAFASNWTAKLEYNYIGLSNSTISTPTIVDVRHDIQMLKVGANYQFGDRTPGAASLRSIRGTRRGIVGCRGAKPHCEYDQPTLSEQHKLQRRAV